MVGVITLFLVQRRQLLGAASAGAKSGALGVQMLISNTRGKERLNTSIVIV